MGRSFALANAKPFGWCFQHLPSVTHWPTEAGAHVIVSGRNADKVTQAMKRIADKDVVGRIQSLINNAGGMMPPEGKVRNRF